MILDNRAGRPGPLGTHFQFRIGDRRMVYCRIRKNGCSSFQNFIVSTSPHQTVPRSVGFRFLRQYHSVPSQAAIENADCRILVYRNPVERMRSLYLNKFVQKKDAVDILKSYRTVTGREPDKASFDEFVFEYVSRIGRVQLDPHVWPQNWHLSNVLYDRVFPLSNLHAEMTRIIGARQAKRFFSRKLNPSRAVEIDISDDTRSQIEIIYSEDIALIGHIEASVPAENPAATTAGAHAPKLGQ